MNGFVGKVAKRLALAAGAGGALYFFLLREGNSESQSQSLPPPQTAGKAANVTAKDVGLNKEFLAQLRRLLPILFPPDRRTLFDRTTLLMGAHTTCLIARTVASIYIASLDGRIVKALIQGKAKRFVALLSVWLMSGVPIAFVNAAIKFLKSQLAQAFRDRLTRRAHEQYLQGLTYYQLEQLDGRLKNPDQAITRDIDKFCSSLADLYSNLAKPALDVGIYQAQLAYNVGLTGLASITVLIHTGTLALRYFTPPFGRLTERLQTLEGNFRFVHARIISNAEEIAFFNGRNGAPGERRFLDEAYGDLRRHAVSLNFAQMRFGVMEDYVVKYFWGALGYLICALPVFTPFGRPPRGVSDSVADRTAAFVSNRRILLNTSDAFGRLMSTWRKCVLVLLLLVSL